MICHICEKENIEDKGIFEESICFECWERNKENFYKQAMVILQKSIEPQKVGCLHSFTKERFDEMCEYVKITIGQGGNV